MIFFLFVDKFGGPKEGSFIILVDQTRDPLDTAPVRQTSDGRLGDSLDIISEDLPVPFGASLSETLTALTTSSHGALVKYCRMIPAADFGAFPFIVEGRTLETGPVI